MSTIEITDQYQKVLDLIDAKHTPVFVTGGAGVGKSTLISHIQKNYKNVVTVAPTGIAALNVSGQTIHSIFMIPPKFITKFDKYKLKASKVLSVTDILIIDEVSMVNANLLDTMEYILRLSNNPTLPFGGVTVVMFGDLYQLPPVVTDDTEKLFKKSYETPYFFSANCLKKCKLKSVQLTKVFRQKNKDFVDILNNIRMGNDIPQTIEKINNSVKIIDKPEDNCIYVTTTNNKCSLINQHNIRKIKKEEYTFLGTLVGKFNLKNIPVDTMVDIKVGCQVMVVRNIQNAVNGTIGTVTYANDDYVQIKTLDTNSIVNISRVTWENTKYVVKNGVVDTTVVGAYTQIPLKLAWAITIHKGQGQTMDRIHIDMDSGAFASGQLYVALSRCTTLEGITMSRPLYTSDVIVDPKVKKFYEALND